jgi:ribosomal protein S6--L-glutamate ligase
VLKLDVDGVDMLKSNAGSMVLEINYSPGFRELEKVAGMDITESTLTSAVSLVRGEMV